ncbi:MAG: cellulase family glycosylhydrolase [Actinomycetota bacterium]|nr:cellulase family glycosylhydrolase [Actinomycetota bacterium]
MRVALAIFIALFAGGAVPPAATGPLAPHNQFGISPGCCIGWATPAERTREFDDYAKIGATWVRFDIPWSHVERRRGRYDWSVVDRVVSAARRRGIRVIGNVTYTPAWARLAPGSDDKHAPANVAHYADFATRVVRRYARRGVKHFELWNEPNHEVFFKPRPDAAHYAAMVRAAYRGMKAVDRSITVMIGATAPVGAYNDPRCARGSNDDSVNINPVTFVERLYASGIHGNFDALSHHPYADPFGPGVAHACSAWAQLATTSPSLRSLMVANGDGSKRIWGTEFGSSAAGVGEETQARFVADAIRIWRTYPWAAGLMIYSYRSPDDGQFNLVRRDWTRRAAWDAYRVSTRQRR